MPFNYVLVESNFMFNLSILIIRFKTSDTNSTRKYKTNNNNYKIISPTTKLYLVKTTVRPRSSKDVFLFHSYTFSSPNLSHLTKTRTLRDKFRAMKQCHASPKHSPESATQFNSRVDH